MSTPINPLESALPLVAAARALGIHHQTLRRWRAAGRLAVIRTASGRLYVPAPEVERLLPTTGHRHDR